MLEIITLFLGFLILVTTIRIERKTQIARVCVYIRIQQITYLHRRYLYTLYCGGNIYI